MYLKCKFSVYSGHGCKQCAGDRCNQAVRPLKWSLQVALQCREGKTPCDLTQTGSEMSSEIKMFQKTSCYYTKDQIMFMKIEKEV